METVKLRSHVGSDGMLKLEIPVNVRDADLDVVVKIEIAASGLPAKTPEELGWPPGFFEATAGSIPDFPNIESEGDFEVRKPLL